MDLVRFCITELIGFHKFSSWMNISFRCLIISLVFWMGVFLSLHLIFTSYFLQVYMFYLFECYILGCTKVFSNLDKLSKLN